MFVLTGTATSTATSKKTIGEREFVAMIATIGGTTALAIDMLLPASGDLREAFPENASRVTLVVTAYFLGLAFAQILYGPLADRFGRKPVLLAGLTLYGIGALASGLAPSFGFLIVSRFIWGVGSAGPRVLSLAIARDLYQDDALTRILSLAMAVFMLTPAIAPLLGEGVLALGGWRWAVGGPAVLVVVLGLWVTRLPESLPPAQRRPLSFTSTREGFRAVLSNRTALGFGLSVMFDLGAFAVFLASSQLIFEEVYDRADSFAYSFAGMSVVMGTVVWLGSRVVGRIGSDRMMMMLLPTGLILGATLLAVSIAGDGAPSFWLWFGLVVLINTVRTMLTPVLNAGAMAQMGDYAGTASAVIGTLSLGGGSILAGFIDRLIVDSVTPLSAAYLGYGILGFAAAMWGRGGQKANKPGNSAQTQL